MVNMGHMNVALGCLALVMRTHLVWHPNHGGL